MASDISAAPPSGRRFDIIVIGGGVIGLSTAYQAAARGLSVLVLEQFENLGDPRASSSGASRMFRVMHSSAPMAKLAQAARTLWGEIEGKLASLPEGGVSFSPEFEACKRIAAEKGVPLREVHEAALKAFQSPG